MMLMMMTLMMTLMTLMMMMMMMMLMMELIWKMMISSFHRERHLILEHSLSSMRMYQ